MDGDPKQTAHTERENNKKIEQGNEEKRKASPEWSRLHCSSEETRE